MVIWRSYKVHLFRYIRSLPEGDLKNLPNQQIYLYNQSPCVQYHSETKSLNMLHFFSILGFDYVFLALYSLIRDLK